MTAPEPDLTEHLAAAGCCLRCGEDLAVCECRPAAPEPTVYADVLAELRDHRDHGLTHAEHYRNLAAREAAASERHGSGGLAYEARRWSHRLAERAAERHAEAARIWSALIDRVTEMEADRG